MVFMGHRGGGGGASAVFEEVSASNYSESGYNMTVTLSQPCKELLGLVVCFGNFSYSYPVYNNGEYDKVLEVYIGGETQVLRNFTITGNQITFTPSIPAHIPPSSIIYGGVSYIPA